MSMRSSAAVAARLHPAAGRRRRCGWLQVYGCVKALTVPRALVPDPTERVALVRLWLRACIQQRSDAVDVEDFTSAAV